jgi:TPP-dependent pyruvate/acetoin dehydrogenase alpha subunit
VARARAGEGATFLHIDCYRWRGHNLNDAHLLYRTQDEINADRQQDPVQVSRAVLSSHFSDDELAAVTRSAEEEVDRAWDESSALRPNADLVFDGVPA